MTALARFAVKSTLLIVTLLAIAPAPTQGQKSGDRGKLVVYDNITDGASPTDRDAKNAYAAMFRLIEIRERDGFIPARMKGHSTPFSDPRSMRDEAVSGKIVYVYVVTADGRVIEPRILQSTDQRVSGYVLKSIIFRRFVPARFQGVPVASLHGDEIAFGSEGTYDNKIFRNGLGIQGYRDR